uniref:AT-rich interactive domain-containing protein 3 n=1 Tax=Anas zonorhyncha TaxID=75864 RepID=A0A8B9U6R4_9AVES
MERRFLWCCPIRVAVWGRLHCQLAPGAAGWLSLLSHPCHLLGGGGHVPWSLPRLRGCVWPSLENRFPARGREEGTDEGLVEVKRQTACRPGEICGDIPRGMNLGGQQDLCPDLCAFWGAHLPWRWLARARRCSPSPCSLHVAFSIGFVPTDAAQGDPRGEEGGGRPAPFLLLLLPAHLPPRCSNNNRRAPGAELEGLWLHRSGTGAVFVPGRGCRQLYELDEDPKRKEFLDDLFSFMQKRGTPVNRIPIMAKQVLDLYTLYRLVTDKGGLVEVINKKIWREITKGLNLPTSITSAAFTLRTQYMKYLYPYECEKRALSSPGELQAAIDSNRREGRRQTFGAALFNYSPAGTPTLLGSPKMPLPALSISTHSCGQMGQAHGVKKEDGAVPAVPGRIAIPVGLAGHHLAAAQAAAAASQAAVLEQLREKLETGEPPEKKVALTAEEQQRLMQQALQHNLLAMASQFPMNIKVSNRDDRQETALNLSTNSISSINMSIEINGVVYTGVLFARRPAAPPAPGGGSTQSRLNPTATPNPPPPAPSHSHTPASAKP